MTASIKDAHGGRLVNLLVDEERARLLKDIALNISDIALNDRQLCDLELLAIGGFSPLTGFMNRSDYESVLDRMRLQNDILWSLPICLDIPKSLAVNLDAGQSLALRDRSFPLRPEGLVSLVEKPLYTLTRF